MPDHPPPPSRRDDTSPAVRDQLRDAWLAELWPVCPEYSREQREIDRALADERVRHRGSQAAA